jgi:hypothetical protein
MDVSNEENDNKEEQKMKEINKDSDARKIFNNYITWIWNIS